MPSPCTASDDRITAKTEDRNMPFVHQFLTNCTVQIVVRDELCPVILHMPYNQAIAESPV